MIYSPIMSKTTTALCGNCTHFSDESATGAGYCSVLDSAWCYCDSPACGYFLEAYRPEEHLAAQTDQLNFIEKGETA